MSRLFLLASLLVLCAGYGWAQGNYTLVVEGFDWGPAVNKVILSMDEPVSDADAEAYKVYVTRSTDRTENPINPSAGERQVINAYASDAKGNRVAEGNYVTLVLLVGPNMRIGSPFQYMRGMGNIWVDYNLAITNTETLRVWDQQAGKIMPLIDDFDLSGKFTSNDLTMSYASFTPKKKQDKYPLIIWLHGGGEGGTDPTIPLLGNRAANYASDEIQQYFGGAYVLVPQSPTRWMDAGDGSTRGEKDDIYFKALKALFDDFTAKHPDIDKNRIYVGGCSNGGYMSMKLLVEYPDYFAAGYISALAYRASNLTDDKVQKIKNIPIWLVHSRDDSTTVASTTAVPAYEKLVKAGAPNVHLSFYDHVVDITNDYGGNGYYYPGHWSWIYSHANVSQTNYDGSPVLVNGVPVTIMQWMALQSRKKK